MINGGDYKSWAARLFDRRAVQPFEGKGKHMICQPCKSGQHGDCTNHATCPCGHRVLEGDSYTAGLTNASLPSPSDAAKGSSGKQDVRHESVPIDRYLAGAEQA